MSLPPAHLRIPGITNTVGVMSGRGGTGKTFVTLNSAATLAKTGSRVGIFDADLYCPSIFKACGVNQRLQMTSDGKIIPIEKHGIKMVSIAGMLEDKDEPIMLRGPLVSKILQKLLKETVWGELDFLFVDFPAGMGDITLTLLQNIGLQGAILVTTPQESSLFALHKTIVMTTNFKVPVYGIVENMRGEVFGEGGGSRGAEMFHVPFLGSIPLRKQFVTLSDQGLPPALHSEDLSMIFNKIARTLRESVVH